MEKYKLSDEDYQFIYSRVPRLCVDLVIKTDKGIILTKRTIEPYPGQLHFPGGGVLVEETINEAIARIAKKELGVKVRILKELGHIEDFTGQETKKHSVSIAFLVEIGEGEPKVDSHAEEIIFTKEIPEDLIDSHKEFLEKNKELIL